MSKKQFTNENRDRAYGLRVGDLVSPKLLTGTESVNGKSKVIEILVSEDENNVKLETEDEDRSWFYWIAENCEIITKVEDIEKPVFSSEKRINEIGYYRELVRQLIQIELYILQKNDYSHKLPNLKNAFANFCISQGVKMEVLIFDAENVLTYDIFHCIEMLSYIMREDYLDNYNRNILQSELNQIYNRIETL